MDDAGPSLEITRAEEPAAAAREATTCDDDLADARSGPLARGSALGRYIVVDPLGAGGMGVVYRAFDPDLDRSVAVKLVGGRERAGSEWDHERTRLLREAQAIARLSHPNVVPVFDVGILDGAVFVAMELVDGLTLRQWLARAPRRWEEIVAVFVQAGRGLEAAHAADLVHRDFKPDNVMVGHDGRVRVLDFGLARATGGSPTGSRSELADLRTSGPTSLERSLTAAGSVMGTPAYMSPEQHVGGVVGPASDQWSFCVALFEALYGERPFQGTNMAKLAFAVLQGKITMPPAAKGKAPAWVHAAVLRGLRPEPEQRFRGMAELLEALGLDPARRRRRVALGVGALGVLGTGALMGARLLTPAPADPGAALCTAAPALVEQVWSPARRQAIGEAFAGAGLGFGEDTWAAVADQLDRTTEAWAAEHTAACRATRITGEQSTAIMDLRMACLERQRGRIDALLDALEQPTHGAIGRAYDAARRLPDPARCGDAEALRETTPPPDDPAARAELDALREALEAVRAAAALGEVATARPRIEPLLPRIAALDYPPLVSEGAALHASLLEQTGEIEASRREHERALAAAIAAGDPWQAAEHARDLAFTVGYRLADEGRGRLLLELARAWLRRVPDGAELGARMDSTEGAMLVAAGRYDEGLAAHARARAYWQAHDPESPELAAVLDDVGAAHVARGEPATAIELHRESLRLKQRAYGPRHPQVASSTRELGNALAHAERWDEALEQLRAALVLEEQSRGAQTQYVATLLDDIGRVLRAQGQLEAAIEHHERALVLWEAVLGDPHPDLGISILNVGYTLSAADRPAEALVRFERALSVFERSVGPQHPYVVYASNSVAATLVGLRRHAEAVPHLERVLALEGLSVDPTLLAETRFTLANALWPDDGPLPPAPVRARARALATEALASYRTQIERWGPQVEQIEAWARDHAG